MLLISEPPLQLLPALACLIGLNDAIFLQQLHYWLPKATTAKDGRVWVYNTIDDWQKQMPFWSSATLRRIVASLEARGLITKRYMSADPRNRTTYYSIDYEELGALLRSSEQSKSGIQPCAQSEQMHVDSAIGCRSASRAIVSSTERTTTETLSCNAEAQQVPKKKGRKAIIEGMVCWHEFDQQAVVELVEMYGVDNVRRAVEVWRSRPPPLPKANARARLQPYPSEIATILRTSQQTPPTTETSDEDHSTSAGQCAVRERPCEPDPLDYYDSPS